MSEILQFVLDGLKSLALAIVLLIAGLLFLPSSWTIFIIARLKPAIFETIKKPLKNFVGILTNLYVNRQLIDLSSEYKVLTEKTEYYLKQNDAIERNMYLIDLSKDLVFTLRFILPTTGVSDHDEFYIQTINYLTNYARIAEPMDQDKNFIINYFNKIQEIESVFNGSNEVHDDRAEIFRDYQIDFIFKYFEEEKKKLQSLYRRNKNELVELVRNTHREL